MLTVKNLTKKYGNFVANQNISFQIDDGETAIMIGPNGAGKTTAINCIAGLLRYQGEITICGHINKSKEARQCFGYVPEQPSPYEYLTISEHLEFIARAYAINDWRRRAGELLERLELTDKQNKLGKELSKGMQQKLNICCALLPEPKLVIFDEPMVGLDPHAIKELKSILLELKNSGCSLLISTHMIDSLNEQWDKAYIMMNGRVVSAKTRKEIEKRGEKLEEIFFAITESKTEEEDK
jgi:ABC-2 type transport system ATP-binding protein